MESKTVILALFVMSLVLAQTQTEAKVVVKSCCPTAEARSWFNVCRLPLWLCAERSGCILITETESCPPDYPYDDSGDVVNSDVVNEYCKLGCVSSACGAITTHQSTDESEILNGAVGQCTKACSTLCTKGSITTPGTATATA